MSEPVRSPAPGPRLTRIEPLDVLRGFAVLGIYMVNVQAFAMPPFAFANPTVSADFGPEGQAAWTAIVALFQMKFITIFSALFGAGIVLMAGEDDDLSRTIRHQRRMFWLLVVGAVHAFGFWHGDILMAYAVSGVLLTQARMWPIRRLVVIGVVLTLVTSVLYLLAASLAALMPAEDYAAYIAESWAPPGDVVEAQRALFERPWPARWAETASLSLTAQINQAVLYLPRFLGVMMIGMALQKSGFFTGRWKASHYWLLAALAPLGALGCWQAARLQMAAGFDPVRMIPGESLLFLASAPQALGYAALAVLACRPRGLAWARAPFAAAGRMALTNYLGCTLVSWFVFYGPPGLGRIGDLTRLEQVGFVLWAWMMMLAASWAWLKAFRFGPFEWVWRSLTYRSPQPWRTGQP